MKFHHHFLTRAASVTASWMIRRLLGTTRFHFRFADPMVNPDVARWGARRYIYSLYHETMLFGGYLWAYPEFQVLVSNSHDGDLTASILGRLGFSVIRGSTSKGGARALREMKRRADQGHLCITPDGPRGPRRHVQPGLIYLASRTGLPIVGLGMAFQDPWRAKSWDRFALPKPFRPAACVVPEPFHIPSDANRETLEEYRREFERRMEAATLEAEAWVKIL